MDIALNSQILKYFSAEKSESLVFILAGLIAVCLSVYFFFQLKEDFYKGMILPLLLIGVIQVVVGSTVYFRTGSDIQKAETYLSESPETLRTNEIPRMETVIKNFRVLKWAEILMAVTGIVLLLVFSDFSWWTGFGVALLAQAVISLILDILAEKRAHDYLEWLNSL